MIKYLTGYEYHLKISVLINKHSYTYFILLWKKNSQTANKIKNKVGTQIGLSYMVHMLKLPSETATECIPSGEGFRVSFN